MKKAKDKAREKPYIGMKIAWFFALFFVFYLLLKPYVFASVVPNCLIFFKTTLIPSIFPFMILCEFLVLSGFGNHTGKNSDGIFHKLFGINSSGAIAFVLGSISGYPIGAKTAISLYTGGNLTKKEAEFLLGISSNGSPGFLIVGIGAVMCGDIKFGIILYVCQILCAILSGAIIYRLNRTRIGKKLKISQKTENNFNVETQEKSNKPDEITGFSQLLSQTITKSTLAMVTICGFVLFFELLIQGLTNMLQPVLNDISLSLVASFIELSAGIKSAITHADTDKILFSFGKIQFDSFLFSKILVFATAAWSGMSVHFQITSFAASHNLSMRQYYRIKILQTLFSIAFAVLLSALTVI